MAAELWGDGGLRRTGVGESWGGSLVGEGLKGSGVEGCLGGW